LLQHALCLQLINEQKRRISPIIRKNPQYLIESLLPEETKGRMYKWHSHAKSTQLDNTIELK